MKKVKNSNNSSVKTEKLIRDAFLDLLGEKKEIGKITVSELTARANISRATFYSHYDDIYALAEEFEKELIDNFFTNAKLLAADDYAKFFDAVFSFLEENDENYKMMCKSNDILLSASRLVQLAINKFMELAASDVKLRNRQFIELDISVILEGIFAEYIKYCRGISSITPRELHDYAEKRYLKFMEEHC